jgi:hypothetical protein
MAPRKSSKRQKVKNRNNKVEENAPLERRRPRRTIGVTHNNNNNTTAKVPSHAKLGSTEPEHNNNNNDQADNSSRHPPDCQCFLKREGNLFLPPSYNSMTNNINNDADDDDKA